MISLDVIQDFCSDMMIWRGCWAFSGMMFDYSDAAGTVRMVREKAQASCFLSANLTTLLSTVLLVCVVGVVFWIFSAMWLRAAFSPSFFPLLGVGVCSFRPVSRSELISLVLKLHFYSIHTSVAILRNIVSMDSIVFLKFDDLVEYIVFN